MNAYQLPCCLLCLTWPATFQFWIVYNWLVYGTHQPTHMAGMKHEAAGIIWLQYKKQLTTNYNLAEKLFMNHDCVRLQANGKCVLVVL